MSAAKRFKVDHAPQPNTTLNARTIAEMNAFDTRLSEFNVMLAKTERAHANPKDFIYEESEEMKRLLQLNLEETIADLKMKNELDVNMDENDLDANLVYFVNELNEKSESMIATVNSHEKVCTALFEKNAPCMKHLDEELKKLKSVSTRFVSNWKKSIAEQNFTEIEMDKAVTKLYEHQKKLNGLAKIVNMLVFSNNLLELKSIKRKQEFHLAYYTELTVSSLSNETIAETNTFTANLDVFDKRLAKLEHAYKSPKDFIYEESEEMRRLLQLDSEETIAEIKQKHELDINMDDNELDPTLLAMVNELKEKTESMITAVHDHEKETLFSFDKNKPDIKDLADNVKKMKSVSNRFVSHWRECVAKQSFIETEMQSAVVKLKEHQNKLNSLVKKFNLLVYNNNLMEMTSVKAREEFQLSHYTELGQFFELEKCEGFDFQQVKHISQINMNGSERLRKVSEYLEKQADGNYFIVFKSNSNTELHFIVFNPVANTVVAETTFCKKSKGAKVNIMSSKDFIAISLGESHLMVVNRELEQIAEKKWKKHGYGCFLGADESCVYARSEDEPTKIDVMDWSLKVTKKLNLKKIDSEQKFTQSIYQFERRDKKCFISTRCHMHIYDEVASVLLKSIEITKDW